MLCVFTNTSFSFKMTVLYHAYNSLLHVQYVYMCALPLFYELGDVCTSFDVRLEGRKKEAMKVKQTTRQINTAHPRQSLLLRKMPRVGLELTTLYTHLHMYNVAIILYSL